MLNKSIRRSMLYEICVFAISFALPIVVFCVPLVRHALQAHLSVDFYIYLVSFDYLGLLFLMAIVWCLFNFYLSLGSVLLNKTTGTVRANGSLHPISAIQAIQVKHVSKRPFATRFLLQLIWKEDNAIPQTPHWKKVLRKMKAKTILGEFRQEANAEKVAEAISEFAGVMVQHQTTGKNSV